MSLTEIFDQIQAKSMKQSLDDLIEISFEKIFGKICGGSSGVISENQSQRAWVTSTHKVTKLVRVSWDQSILEGFLEQEKNTDLIHISALNAYYEHKSDEIFESFHLFEILKLSPLGELCCQSLEVPKTFRDFSAIIFQEFLLRFFEQKLQDFFQWYLPRFFLDYFHSLL